MDFDSPDVMKDFPGLYASDLHKKCNSDSDYSDETDKPGKKDILIGKRKDKKDKEKGYAALEGESSDENSKSRSPSKSKKSKSFKFTTSKSKEKREKSREKEVLDKKKEKEKKVEKSKSEKGKKFKSGDEVIPIADALPIFGVSLDIAVDRSRCHDGVDIPLPVRQCLDYLENVGISFEGIYKVSGTKSKVLHIKKMFNNRENVSLQDYDVPTSTSLLKMFLRDLPEPLFTNDLLIRFEEAGAILNTATREKHLKILLDHLPSLNKLLLSWLLIHLENICTNEKYNKMNRNNISAALNHTFHISSRLLNALLYHSESLFPTVSITPYVPPLPAGAILPAREDLIQIELQKQESLLNQIHKEMNIGCISKQREELLWEVQRIITQLKRKMKSVHKDKEVIQHGISEERTNLVTPECSSQLGEHNEQECSPKPPPVWPQPITQQSSVSNNDDTINVIPDLDVNVISVNKEEPAISDEIKEKKPGKDQYTSNLDNAIKLFKLKNHGLLQLKESLLKQIETEQKEIINLKSQPCMKTTLSPIIPCNENLDEIMNLLQKENHILQIKKINLVRQSIEQKEICIDLKAKIELIETTVL